MVNEQPPELKRFMSKRVSVKLNAGRLVTGRLVGFDVHMNIVLEDAVEELSASERNALGVMIVRGNSILEMEALEKTEN